MLRFLKAAAIVGAIFALSPARDPEPGAPQRAGPASAAGPTLLDPGRIGSALAGLAGPEGSPLPAGLDPAALGQTWRSLPEGTRQRLLKLLVQDGTAPAAEAPAQVSRRAEVGRPGGPDPAPR